MSEVAISDSNGEFWLFGYGSLIWKPPPHFGKLGFCLPLTTGENYSSGASNAQVTKLSILYSSPTYNRPKIYSIIARSFQPNPLIYSKPPDLRVPGYITGYVRRFWQASEDHRGTPSSPGRVVTLIERSFWETLGEGPTKAPERVYGAAYRIPPGHVKEVQEYLDIREINGYSIQYTSFYPSPPTSLTSASDNSRPLIEKCLVYIGLPSNPQFLGRQQPQDVAEVIATSTGPSGANAEYLFMLEDSLMELGDGSGDEHVGDLAERVRFLKESGKEKGLGSEEGEESASELKMQALENEVKRVSSGRDGQATEETEKVSQL